MATIDSYFPTESVEMADRIVAFYDTRFKSQRAKANNLYSSAFLELKYGFSEALRKGKPAQFLHEASQEVECLSLCGINYLLAKKLGLKPRAFEALGMADVKEGTDPERASKGSHAFITIQMGGSEYMFDPSYSKFGKVDIGTSHMKIHISKRTGEKVTYQRKYDLLHELDEEALVTRISDPDDTERGRKALEFGQRVNYKSIRVNLEHDPQENTIITSADRTPSREYLLDGADARRFTHLCYPITDEGKLDEANGRVDSATYKKSNWLRSQNELPYLDFSHSLADIEEGTQLLEKLVRDSGRKTPIAKTKSFSSASTCFDKLGFNFFGNLKDNDAFDASEYNVLVERLIADYIGSNSDDSWVARRVALMSGFLGERAKLDENGEVCIFSSEDQIAYREKVFDKLSTGMNGLIVPLKNKKAKALQLPENMDGDNVNFERTMTDLENKLRNEERLVSMSGGTETQFNDLVDWMLYTDSFSEGSLPEYSQEDLDRLKTTLVTSDLQMLTQFLDKLKLKQYRKGIEKFLSV